MGMNTHIVGYKAPDEKWQKMKAVWDACETAGAPIPSKVLEYFNHDEPDEAGVKVNLELASHAVIEWNEEMKNGFEVDLKKLREEFPDLTHIRFYNSY